MKRVAQPISLFLTELTLGLCALLQPEISFGQTISYGTAVPVETQFTAPASDETGKPRGISGMACLRPMGSADQGRECLIINDEEMFAEIAILKTQSLRPTGRVISIVEHGESGKGIVGIPRPAECEQQGRFGELDGEGVAIGDGYAYVIGSHSCSGSGKFRPSSYLTSRFKLASPARIQSDTTLVVERSWRGADMLFLSSIGSAYGKPKGEGTNIEGVAVVGENLYAGLRTPLAESSAFLIRAPVGALFAPGREPLPDGSVETRSLPLGEGAGIRDLAALADGSLLILSGPSLEQPDVDYKVWRLPNPIWIAQPVQIAIIKTNAKAKEPGKTPKAEALTIIEQSDSKVVVLVSYDNVDEGAPTRHELVLLP